MNISEIIHESLHEAVIISLYIFLLMVVLELIVLKWKEKIISFTKNNKWSEHILGSFMGILPGCTGTFAMDTLYMSGLISFGGLSAVMIATMGDESFVIISMVLAGEISITSLLVLVLALFTSGIIGGLLANIIKKKLNISIKEKCEITHHKEVEFSFKHFVKVHIYEHILKKHIWQIFLWIFIAFFLIEIANEHTSNLKFDTYPYIALLFIAGLIGVLPLSGPNILFLIMFSQGIIPFSILLTNSIVQDGHGLLPILGYSFKDAVKIKIFNLCFGLIVGGSLYALGF